MDSNNPMSRIRCEGIAAVLLKKFGDEYKVLLLKRATPVLKGVWCYIGGGVEDGEKVWEAALREIREETGISKVTLYNSNEFDRFYNYIEDYIYVAPVFVGYVDESEEVALNCEHSDYRWLSFDEALETVIIPGNDTVLERIRKNFADKDAVEWLQVN